MKNGAASMFNLKRENVFFGEFYKLFIRSCIECIAYFGGRVRGLNV